MRDSERRSSDCHPCCALREEALCILIKSTFSDQAEAAPSSVYDLPTGGASLYGDAPAAEAAPSSVYDLPTGGASLYGDAPAAEAAPSSVYDLPTESAAAPVAFDMGAGGFDLGTGAPAPVPFDMGADAAAPVPFDPSFLSAPTAGGSSAAAARRNADMAAAQQARPTL